MPPLENRPAVTVDWDVDESLDGKVESGFLELVLTEALTDRHLGSAVEVSLTITTDQGIRDLNSRYRDVDSATDVLSFPLMEYERPELPKSHFPAPLGAPISLGDIVISHPRAVEQAGTYGHSLERELAFLIVHGTMHLLGYDHKNAADEQRMRHEEEAVLSRLNLTR